MSEGCCEQGPRGYQGPAGPKGDKGDRGEQGFPGAPGLTGPMGPMGPMGGTGPTGPMGIAGLPGGMGPAGPPGSAGTNGTDGTDGADGAPATIVFTETCDIAATQVQGAPDYIFELNINDTGWVDLLGFTHYGVGVTKPQVRRIGSVLHFRGTVIIPLSSNGGATLISLATASDYDRKAYASVYTGAGGVNVNVNGSITFNNNSSIIPASVLCSKTLDSTYSVHKIAQRQIVVGGTVAVGTVSGGAEGVSLAAALGVSITNTGVLIVSTLRDVEQSSVGPGATLTGGSPLRLITSNVVSGRRVPKYNDATSTIHDATAAGTSNLDALFTADKYNFSCDAGEPDQIGGFVFRLDGMMSYLTI